MQLVIGMCLLLTFGLGCFLLGVLIGKFDPSLREQTAANDEAPVSAPASYGLDRGDVRAQAPRQVESRGLPPELRPPQNLVEPEKPTSTPEKAPEPEVVEAPVAQPQPEAENPSAPAKPADPEVTQAEPPKATPESEKPAASTAPEQVQVTPPPSPTPTPAVTAPPKSTGGNFGVQIIAVARVKAEGVKRDVEAKSKYKAQIIPIDGDRLCKVVVGRFADRQAADTVRGEMKSKYGFSDAYVIVLP